MYESPYRIEKLLGELEAIFPGREVVVARELTKKVEEYLRGNARELLEIYKKRAAKGEFVVMISPADQSAAPGKTAPAIPVGSR